MDTLATTRMSSKGQIVIPESIRKRLNLSESICEDPDDDKFFACALASGAMLIVSGDKHLLKVSGYQDIEVLTPRIFVDRYLV